jgi:sugar phosphate isomerase/epimerase
MADKLSRRRFMATSAAAAALTLVPRQGLRGAEPAAPTGKMALTIGMATMGFTQLTNQAMAELLAKAGVRTAQLFLTQTDSNYWKYNQRSDVSALTVERCAAIAGAYRTAGVSIHSLGVYANLIHPDPAERKANLDYFEAMMVGGGRMGVRTFISEAGHYQPKERAGGLEYHLREDVWKTMVATGKELAALAQRHDAVVLLEPYFAGFLTSAKRTRQFIEEIGSRRIRALLDPANILEVNDLEEMFGQLRPHLDCIHAKDRKLHVERGVPAGQGDLDYRQFVTLAAQRAPNAPLIMEYIGANNYQQALAHLRKVMREAGVAEK